MWHLKYPGWFWVVFHVQLKPYNVVNIMAYSKEKILNWKCLGTLYALFPVVLIGHYTSGETSQTTH